MRPPRGYSPGCLSSQYQTPKLPAASKIAEDEYERLQLALTFAEDEYERLDREQMSARQEEKRLKFQRCLEVLDNLSKETVERYEGEEPNGC